MSKKRRHLIIFIILLVIVAAAAVVLLVTAPSDRGEGDASSSSSAASSSLPDLIDKKDLFESVELTNEHGTYSIYAKTEDKKISYYVEGYEGLDVVSDVTSAIVTNCSDVTPSRNLGTVDDLSEYGLDKPRVTMKAKFSDGEEITMYVGNSAVADSSYYIRLEGSDEVYIAGLSEYLFIRKEDCLNLALVYEIQTDENDEEIASVIGRITLTGTNYPDRIIIEQNQLEDESDPLYSYSYILKEPTKSPLGNDIISDLTPSLEKLVAEEAVVGNPTSEQLAEYGFDNPAAAIDYIVNDNEVSLTVGKIDGEYAYLMREGNNAIFKVKAENVPWATTSEFELRNPLIFVVYLSSIENIKVTTADGMFEFNRERTLNEEDTEEYGKNMYDYKTFYNGTEMDSSNFSQFYQVLIGIAKDKFPEGETPSGAADITIEFEYYDEFNRENTVIELFDVGDRKALYRLNGVDTMIIKNSYISKITSDVQKVIKNEQVTAL